MTYLLTIDTTAGTSVAIHHDGQLLAQQHHDSGVRHAELIGQTIAGVLTSAGLKPTELSAVAVGRGPGLFTGLRVGLAAAIWFAQGIEKPLFGLMSLDGIALEYFTQNPEQRLPVLIHTDARRGEVYWALYSGLDQHGLPKLLQGPNVGKLDAVVDLLLTEFGSFDRTTGGARATWLGNLADLQFRSQTANSEVSAIYLRAPDAAEPKPNTPIGKRVSS